MSHKDPCKNCLTYIICKNQISPYLQSNNKRESTIGLMQTIGKKCNAIADYVKKQRDVNNELALLDQFHSVLMRVFTDEN